MIEEKEIELSEVGKAIKVLEDKGFTYHISNSENETWVSKGIDPINSYIETTTDFTNLNDKDIYSIIEKFQKGKSDDIISSFDEIYNTIQDTILEGGTCLYSYYDMLMEITGDKVEVFNNIMRCLSNIYDIKFIDMSGTITLNEDMSDEYTITKREGLTLEFIRK